MGRLKGLGIDVHRRAAKVLQQNCPQPTQLHQNVLRFFGNSAEVRVVTTNFDELFEGAALGQFDPQPRVFTAPALPLGSRFHGIIHLHGSVNEPEEMVLTDQDFGRAYLTEADGWARRFLVDLFTSYTVLFVGYSHSDTIMNYLTPSLPPDGNQSRFTLVGDQSNDLDHWRRMGIEPITFEQTHANDFSGLDTAVKGLADFVRRGILDWQREITKIACGLPPIDEESAGIIEHAFSDPVMTRFFVEDAESPEWIPWLDRRRYLNDLFNDGELNEQDGTLIQWLVSRFAMAHDNELFTLIGKHGRKIHRELWRRLDLELQHSIQQSPDAQVITRWVLFLTSTIPQGADDLELSWLAKACASIGAADGLLRVYWAITASINPVPLRSRSQDAAMFHHRMKEIFSEYIAPNMRELAEPLLTLTTIRLEERHAVEVAWKKGDSQWSPDIFSRSAIEPHEQDKFEEDVDALIDTARECLEYLAKNDPTITGRWCDRHSQSKSPLLRRLAIHAMSARTDLTDDDKIAWLLERCDISEIAARHEIFRAAANAYPLADEHQRQALIESISLFRPQYNERDHEDKRTAYYHFNWFHWLHQSDPSCKIAKAALDSVWKQHPDFVPREHPDLIYYFHTGRVTSRWTVDMLLMKAVHEVLPYLLSYEPTDQQRFDGYDRCALLSTIKEAAKINPSWGLAVADAMVEQEEWDADLWRHVIAAWSDAEFDNAGVNRVLAHLSADELHRRHTREIARVLVELPRQTTDAGTVDFLNTANQIAIALRLYAAEDEVPQMTSSIGGVPQYVSWLTNAINHTSGHIARFWIYSIGLWKNQQHVVEQSLSAGYRDALDATIGDAGTAGKFGRSVLSSYFQFLLAVDEEWTVANLAPLFDIEHEDFQCAWDGFLTWGRLSPRSVEVLGDKFIAATSRVSQEFQGQMLEQFVKYYVGALSQTISSANEAWISEFFKNANADMKRHFGLEIYQHLRDSEERKQQEWWSIWLKDYWQNRLQGVPIPLDEVEIPCMLGWAMHLPAVFPEAVSLATHLRSTPLNIDLDLHDIDGSDLIQQHPVALAELLIHFGKCETQPWFWSGTRATVDRLLAKELPLNVDTGLRELIAKKGHWMDA